MGCGVKRDFYRLLRHPVLCLGSLRNRRGAGSVRDRGMMEIKNRLSEFQITGLNRDLSGNRTRVYAVRGRRLDRLTNRP